MHSWKILITEKRNTFDTISSFQLQSTSENFTNHDITWVKAKAKYGSKFRIKGPRSQSCFMQKLLLYGNDKDIKSEFIEISQSSGSFLLKSDTRFITKCHAENVQHC